MKIDRNKLIKSALILVALFVVVTGLTKIMEHNTLTLTEYADRNPESANPEESESTEEYLEGNDSMESASGETSSDESDPEQTASDETDAYGTEIMSLTGESLNANTMEEFRITYADSFYYEPLSDNLRRYITGVSFPPVSQSEVEVSADDLSENSASDKPVSEDDTAEVSFSENELAITYDELRYVHILHYDFDGKLTEGELICNKYIAQDLVEIFYELYRNEYRLEKVRLIDEYDGDDTASMEDNNTSCFNYRMVAGSTSLSKHALGLAIDINPFYNPYITYGKDGSEQIAPASAAPYADRNMNFPYKIDTNDLCYKLFTERGFTWGGNWNSSKDYQHFQKVITE